MTPQRKPKKRCWYEYAPPGSLRAIMEAQVQERGHLTLASACAAYPGQKFRRYKVIVTVEEL